jgi:beta-xylosidase
VTRAARAALALAVATAVAAGLGGCSASSSHGSGGSTTTKGSAPRAPAGTYVNPVLAQDTPDPWVLQVGGTFHLYATQGGGSNVQTATSPDLVHWTPSSDALPQLGAWAQAGSTWAPEVIQVGGGFVMFYVAHDSRSGKQCIGRATASDAAAPFSDTAPRPIVCQPALGGSIDPDAVRGTDGKLYLYWKNDGNCCGQPVHLWGQQLSAGGERLTGRPTALLTNTKAWQGNLVEAPEMVVHDGAHVLLYSANNYASADYAIGWASCVGPLGPCTDQSERPLVATTTVAAGPGHCAPVTLADGSTWLLFHAWQPDGIGTTYPGRQLWLEPITWDGGRPSVTQPTDSPQRVPPN